MPAQIEPGTAREGIAVSKSDTTVYTPPLDALRVGTAGDVTVRVYATQLTLTIPDVLAGETIPLRIDQVRSTSTAASGFTGYRY